MEAGRQGSASVSEGVAAQDGMAGSMLGGLSGALKGTTGPIVGLLLLGLFLSLATDSFLSVRNFLNILDQITVLGIMAVGMTFVILIGGIDLSVGSVLALSMMVLGYLNVEAGMPMPVAMAGALAASAVAIVVFGLLARKGITHWWLLIPIALVAWGTMHAAGVHATIAGVALGMVVPAVARKGERSSLAEHWEHVWRPVSAGVAVPVFALFAAGVAISASSVAEAAGDPIAQGIFLGLVIGKPLGILVFTFIAAKVLKQGLDRGLSWWDVGSVGFVAGIGFTVSLLIGDLAFAGEGEIIQEVKMSVLFGSVTAAIIGAALLSWRDRHYRRIYERRSTPIEESRIVAQRYGALGAREDVDVDELPAPDAEDPNPDKH